MIPSHVPLELQNLTHIEEMLIARALPIMRVYIKPGGQRGYSGHCINLPQNVTELAISLPRYPKDLAIIIVKVKGRDNTFRDVTVRKQNVHNALMWLITNNAHYSQLTINEDALNSLPENGVPPDLMTVETDDDIVSDDNCSPDAGPPTGNPSEDIVYNDSTEMSSFLPVGEQQQQKIFCCKHHIHKVCLQYVFFYVQLRHLIEKTFVANITFIRFVSTMIIPTICGRLGKVYFLNVSISMPLHELSVFAHASRHG